MIGQKDVEPKPTLCTFINHFWLHGCSCDVLLNYVLLLNSSVHKDSNTKKLTVGSLVFKISAMVRGKYLFLASFESNVCKRFFSIICSKGENTKKMFSIQKDKIQLVGVDYVSLQYCDAPLMNLARINESNSIQEYYREPKRNFSV